jgi:hypothetical protein
MACRELRGMSFLAGGREAAEMHCGYNQRPHVLEYLAGRTECPRGRRLLHPFFPGKNTQNPTGEKDGVTHKTYTLRPPAGASRTTFGTRTQLSTAAFNWCARCSRGGPQP